VQELFRVVNVVTAQVADFGNPEPGVSKHEKKCSVTEKPEIIALLGRVKGRCGYVVLGAIDNGFDGIKGNVWDVVGLRSA